MTIQKLPTRRVVPTLAEDQANIAAQRKPWLAMGCLVAAAAAEQLAETLTGAEAQTAWTFAVAAFAAAVVIGCLSRGRYMGKKLRRRFILAVWSGAGWLTYVGFVGMSLGLVGTMVAVGAAIAWPFLKAHRIHGRPLAIKVGPDADHYGKLWEKNIGSANGSLPGSRIHSPIDMPGVGLRYVLELVPGKQDLESAMTAKGIRGGLGLRGAHSVVIEQHPEEPEPTCLLTIVTSSPIASSVEWPGPEAAFDPVAGSVNMGPFADGDGVAQWSAYRRNGLFGGLIQGAPGSGKSRLLETIAVTLASSKTHPTVVWFGCGQNGASSKLLVENADNVAVTGDQMLEMLEQAVRVMDINDAENAAWGLDGFTPGHQVVVEHSADCDEANEDRVQRQCLGCAPKEVVRKGLIIIVDEFQKFLFKTSYARADDVARLMEDIARRGRKVGVALILATQVPTLSGSFGTSPHADGLRMCLLEGNGLILRSNSKDVKMVFGVDVDPRQFPKTPGYGFLCDPMPGARSAPFRSFIVTEKVFLRWATSFTWEPLLTRQANCAGATYLRRRENKLGRRTRARRLLSNADHGQLFEAVEETMQQAAATVASEGEFVFAGETLIAPAGAPKFTWGAAPEPKLSPAAEAVLGVLKGADGEAQLRKRAMEETGKSKGTVHNGITELVEKGLIEKAEHGAYRLV